MPDPVVEPSPLPSRELRPLAPDDAQDASYFAASARIASLRLRPSETLSRFILCSYQRSRKTAIGGAVEERMEFIQCEGVASRRESSSCGRAADWITA